MKILFAAGIAIALVSVSGCDRSAAASTVVPNLTPPAPAGMPIAAAGRWRYLQQVDAAPADMVERCRTTADTIQEITMAGTPPARGCTRAYAKKGEGWNMRMVCGADAAAITVDAFVSGDIETGYELQAIRTSGPGAHDFPSQTLTVHAERLGDC